MVYVHHRLQEPSVIKGRRSNITLEMAGLCFLAFWKWGVSTALMPLGRSFSLPSPRPTSQVLISSSITLKPTVKRCLWSQRTDFINSSYTINSQVHKRRESRTLVKSQETDPNKKPIYDEILENILVRKGTVLGTVCVYSILLCMLLVMSHGWIKAFKGQNEAAICQFLLYNQEKRSMFPMVNV